MAKKLSGTVGDSVGHHVLHGTQMVRWCQLCEDAVQQFEARTLG